MRKVFEIGKREEGSDHCLIEWGREFCLIGMLNKDGKIFHYMAYYSFSEMEALPSLKQILSTVDQADLKFTVCAAVPEALLIPEKFSDSSTQIFQSVFSNELIQQFNDQSKDPALTISYGVDSSILSLFRSLIPGFTQLHAYTPWLKIYNGFLATDQVDIHFNTGSFRVMVKKAKQLMLVQTYNYQTPLDVVYYLLRIAQEWQLEQTSCFVIISGLVEKDSAMYQELNHYFQNLHFSKSPDFQLPETDYQPHYFTSLFNLGACVL